MRNHKNIEIQIHQRRDGRWILSTRFTPAVNTSYLLTVAFEHTWIAGEKDTYVAEISSESETLRWHGSWDELYKTWRHDIRLQELESILVELKLCPDDEVPYQELVEDALWEDFQRRNASPNESRFYDVPELIECIEARWQALNVLAIFSPS